MTPAEHQTARDVVIAARRYNAHKRLFLISAWYLILGGFIMFFTVTMYALENWHPAIIGFGSVISVWVGIHALGVAMSNRKLAVGIVRSLSGAVEHIKQCEECTAKLGELDFDKEIP